MPLKSLFRSGKTGQSAPESRPPSSRTSTTPSSVSATNKESLPYRPHAQAARPQGANVPAPVGVRSGPAHLPQGWIAEWDRNYGCWYYVNTRSGRSQWNRPSEAPAPFWESDSRPMASPQVPSGWKAEWDTHYRAWFYVNIQNGRSQWDRPKLLYPERRDHNSVQRTQGNYAYYGKWYKFEKEFNSLPESHPDYLCNTCKQIDLRHIFYRSAPARTAAAGAYIHLGPFREMAEQQTCGLCRIVVSTIRERIKLSTKHEGFQLDDDVEELLNANWFLSPFVYEHESKPPTYNLILQHDKSPVLMEPREDTPFALRLIVNAERGGRRIPEDTLDFAWIRSTISLCDINTKMSKRDFDYPILVVDTEEMCLVELDVDTKEEYVALSYPWGNVEQYGLIQQREATFRRPGSLQEVFDRLARTIQDAITLVSKVGRKYLWVDCLCIVQDDPIQKDHHVNQMEKIYRYAWFTIFAVSSVSADSGLPGMRKGSRALKQVVQNVDGLTLANCLPNFNDNATEDSTKLGTWGTRAWTFQERFFSQRALFVGSDGMYINCAHIATPEDEHCWHSTEFEERSLVSDTYHFFAGLDKRTEPYLGFFRRTTFDSYAIFIYDYSQRKLKYETDAIRAFSGILREQKTSFGSEMLWALPEGEFDASLLWSPIGPSARRTEFPSWSWVGWTGGAAYYWTHERDTFVSIENSPLEWLDAAVAKKNIQTVEPDELDAAWFTSDDLCLPKADLRDALLRSCRNGTDDHLSVRPRVRANRATWRAKESFRHYWPSDTVSQKFYIASDDADYSRRLTFRTLTAYLTVVGQPFQREKNYNIKESIWRLAVVDSDGFYAGYIDISNPEGTERWRSYLGLRYFAVLSRSTIDGHFEPPPDRLESRRKKRPLTLHSDKAVERNVDTLHASYISNPEAYVNKTGWFDLEIYEESRPWCMFNVLLLQHKDGIVYRQAIGRIHVDAFLAGQSKCEVIQLE